MFILRNWPISERLAWLYVVACAASIFYLQTRGSVAFFISDEISWWRLIDNAYHGKLALRDWIAPHNNHPVWTAHALVWLVVYFDLPWNVPHYLYTVASVFLVGLIARQASLAGVFGWRLALIIVAASAALMSGKHFENLYWSIQSSFIFAVIATVWAFGHLQCFAVKGTYRHVVGALIAAFIALVSLGAGAVTWVLTLLGLWLIKPTKINALLALALVGLGAGLLKYTQQFSDYITPSAPIASFAAMFEYFLLTLANGFWLSEHATSKSFLAAVCGAIVLIVSLFVLWRQWPNLKRSYANPLAGRNYVVIGMIAFSLGCLMLITVSRTAFGQPNASRYTIFVVPLMIAVIWHLLFVERSKIAQGLGVLFSLALVIVNVVQFRIEQPISVYRFSNIEKEWARFCAGEKDFSPPISTHNIDGMEKMQTVFCTRKPNLPERGWRLVPAFKAQ